MKIPFCKPFIGQEEINAVVETLKSGWLTSSKKGEEFEQKFAEYVGAQHVILLSSCTAALQLSLEWYKKKYDIKKVLVPSITFAATVQEVIHAGLEPIFGDVDKNILLSFSNKAYDAVIPVHLYGNKAKNDWDDTPCIEDSAHLIERNQCKDNSNAVCFSFYATKNLTMGEGGAIATNDEEFYHWAHQARHSGISKDGWKRYEDNGNWWYESEFVGWKLNQSDILAVIGLEQLKKFDKIQAERKRCVDLYNKLLEYNNQGLHLMPILVEDRNKFMEAMKEAEISCGVHFLPLHKMPAYKKYAHRRLANSEFFGEHLISLPLFPSLMNKEIEYICSKVKETKLLIKIIL